MNERQAQRNGRVSNGRKKILEKLGRAGPVVELVGRRVADEEISEDPRSSMSGICRVFERPSTSLEF